ncbi:MAG TPA: hypothetical protein VJU82_12725, partial [Acidobacteriaceae bacterium]|nr:hypothetical protein [Acidobacteriaceae bacterium]
MQQPALLNINWRRIRPSPWLIPEGLCLLAEFLWLMAGIAIAGYGLPIVVLGLLQVGVVIATGLYTRVPWLCPAAAWINFIGCAAIKTTPQVPHRAVSFFYTHSVDLALIL